MPEPRAGMRWRAEFRYFFVALGYFTRVRIPRRVGHAAGDLDQAARYFPLIGVYVGALAAAVYLLAALIWPLGVAVLLSMAVSLLATGAFHEDGLADSCDGFGGYTREDVLRIMRDSHIGTFGAVGLVLALALKWQALTALPPLRASWTLLAAHAGSRVAAVSLLMTLDYAREEGKVKPVAHRMSVRAFAFAALCGLPWLFWPDWRAGLTALAALLVMRALLTCYLRRRFGGYTGDCLGFAQQLSELTIYLTVLGWTWS